MAKKNKRTVVGLECKECKRMNYTAYRSSSQKEKLAVNKYCSTEQRHTEHKQIKVG